MTISIKIKEIMANMPDTLNTKKEVDDYYKNAIAKVLKDNKVDKENKPKKELNAYQKFMKENISIVKNENPKLTGPEVFSIIAAKWKKQKEVDGVKEDDVNVDDDDIKVADVKVEDVKVDDDDIKVADVKVKEDKEFVKEVKKKDKKVK